MLELLCSFVLGSIAQLVRVPALHAGGHRFEPCCFHHVLAIFDFPVVVYVFGPVVQLVRTLACHARGRRFESVPGRHYCAFVAQLVEQRTENPRVDGSIPSEGTILCGFSSSGRAPPCQGGGSGFEPRNPLHFFIWHHSQVVRQRSAKPLCPGSNPGGASTKRKSSTEGAGLFRFPPLY